MPYRITFVCTGNICRSPMAEHVFRRHAEESGLDVEVDSSGTARWHAGAAADPRTVAALHRAGYGSAHIARWFRPDWFDRYDLIVALDRGHHRELTTMAPDHAARGKVRLLREFDPDADGLSVADPYHCPDTVFDEILREIEAAMPGLLDHIGRRLKACGDAS